MSATPKHPTPTDARGAHSLHRRVGAQFSRELPARRGQRETEPEPFASSRGCLPLPRRRVLSALKYRPGIIMLMLSCGHRHTWQGWDCRKAPKTTGCAHCPNDLPQPQPPGSQLPPNPRSSVSPATAESRRGGGCWLEGAGWAMWLSQCSRKSSSASFIRRKISSACLPATSRIYQGHHLASQRNHRKCARLIF
jgi:hypothetical protein